MKFSGPEEIYKELVEESEESWLHGLMAFAVIEEQKIEWMRHEEKSTGSLPNANEIRAWYEQQPFVINDISPVKIGSQLRNQVEDNPNG